MKDQQDAYGHALFDYLKSGRGQEIAERDDGFVAAGIGPSQYFAPYPQWPAHERQAMRHVRGRVLDVGCGAGRVALYLQQRGHDVVGIDISPLAIEVCRLRGVRNARLMSITQVSSDLGSFDTVVMTGNNFGLFGNARRGPWLLRRFHAMTSGRGRILAESRDPHETDDPAHLAYQRRNVERGRMPGQIRLRVRYRDFATRWFDYLLVSPQEMEVLLDGTGWRVSRIIDSDSNLYFAVIDKAP